MTTRVRNQRQREIGRRVVERLREGELLTQDQLARAVGVSRQTVNNWETGMVTPSVRNLGVLVRVWGQLSRGEPVGVVVSGEENT